MKKLRHQAAFGPLNDAEIQQIADWLQTAGYEDVRRRIAKPRGEGGFDLHISIKPLRVLYQRNAQLQMLNSQSEQKLSLKQFLDLLDGEPAAVAEVGQHVLQKAAFTIVTSSGEHLKPAELLAFARIFTLPDKQKFSDHQIEMDRRRAAIAEKRYELAERRLADRQQKQAPSP